MMYQHELRDATGHRRVCWLDRRLHCGARLTLADTPERWWTVWAVYATPVEKQALHKPWRVGGLG